MLAPAGRRGFFATGITSLALLLVPSAAGHVRAAGDVVTITPYYQWSARGSACPAGAATLEPKRVVIPAAGQSVTTTWVGTIPYPCTKRTASCTFNRAVPGQGLPAGVTAKTECLIPPSGAIDRICDPVVPAGVVPSCGVKFTLVLTSTAAPPKKECQCATVSVRPTRTRLNFTDLSRFYFQVQWSMRCTGSRTGTCEGAIGIAEPLGLLVTTPPANVTCKGRCAKGTATGSFFVGGTYSAKLRSLKGRAGRTFVITIVGSCLRGNAYERTSQARLRVVYDSRGIVDQKRSRFPAP